MTRTGGAFDSLRSCHAWLRSHAPPSPSLSVYSMVYSTCTLSDCTCKLFPISDFRAMPNNRIFHNAHLGAAKPQFSAHTMLFCSRCAMVSLEAFQPLARSSLGCIDARAITPQLVAAPRRSWELAGVLSSDIVVCPGAHHEPLAPTALRHRFLAIGSLSESCSLGGALRSFAAGTHEKGTAA